MAKIRGDVTHKPPKKVKQQKSSKNNENPRSGSRKGENRPGGKVRGE